MTVTAAPVLAQAGSAVVGAGETAAFWVLGPLALVGALGMVFARNAVHSALWLVLTMLCLGVLYMAQSASFLGFTQIIVYTGAIMMLFLFVLMMVGRDASDSVVEVLRGQRLWAGIGGVALAVLLTAGLSRALVDVPVAAPLDPWAPSGGGAGGLGMLIFTDYLFPFELTSALLITAAVGAMVLAYGGKGRGPRLGQRDQADARFRGDRPSPQPGPGVYATANSVAVPALLPDGSVAPESMSELLANLPADELVADREAVAGTGPEPDPHALTEEPAREHGSGAQQEPSNGTVSDPEGESGPASEPEDGNNGDGTGSAHASPEEVRQ
ncbi:NADH-quinone oxidoreductase subunit J [Saccharopolyspora sp. HNM0983]|uniref:NADH-quinone oxidoreductase subunit J n=1 Tax=Saccharopolyspora montiporae TaxID=2781240 RepID=A0A929G023_9PSEU|nr:NADH-quinone oxidoreductase subunit J [Saccharopolyspora sp. HNM0983]MBE9374919.1 NADH-quinone oxidoreductase subunit J [Saccharopolyspora sp. HNM0983]